MKLKCTICLENKPIFLCSNCTNLLLLPIKLQYFEVLSQNDTLKSKIEEILKNCIKNENYNYMKKYIENEGEDKEGVAALSSQLLTIDTLISKRRNNKIIKEIEALNKLKKSKKFKIDQLKAMITNKRLKKPDNNKLAELKQSTNQQKQDQLKIQNQIDISKSLLFQELLTLYTLKRRKLSISSSLKSTLKSSQKFIYTISFTPIISIWNLLEFNIEIVNSSVLNITKLVSTVSNILQIDLPYSITNTNIDPKIGNFKMILSKELYEISTFELRLFINGFTRLIYNILVILKELNQMNGITTEDLLKLDELVYRLGNKEQTNQGEEAIDLKDVDIDHLTNECLEQIMLRINNKNNEWQVVKDLEFE